MPSHPPSRSRDTFTADSQCLSITLMGAFHAKFARDPAPDIHIDDAAWGRPAVKRLLIYFALNMGHMLPRDRILDDLWPGSPFDTAHGSFKTTFSLLRKALEPNLPPKAPSRFFNSDQHQQAYAFNLHNDPALARTDLSTFDTVVQRELNSKFAHDAAVPSPLFLDALATWRQLAPEFAREQWAIETGERLLSRYSQACMHTANAFADLARPADAAQWADRAARATPWSEDAWHLAIRAHARTGDTARALAVCDAAAASLHHEMGAPPSTLLIWLAEQLRAGHAI